MAEAFTDPRNTKSMLELPNCKQQSTDGRNGHWWTEITAVYQLCSWVSGSHLQTNAFTLTFQSSSYGCFLYTHSPGSAKLSVCLTLSLSLYLYPPPSLPLSLAPWSWTSLMAYGLSVQHTKSCVFGAPCHYDNLHNNRNSCTWWLWSAWPLQVKYREQTSSSASQTYTETSPTWWCVYPPLAIYQQTLRVKMHFIR